MNIFLTISLDTKNNHLIETVLLSTHNICFDQEIRKLIFNYALLSRGMWGIKISTVWMALVTQPRWPSRRHPLVKLFKNLLGEPTGQRSGNVAFEMWALQSSFK